MASPSSSSSKNSWNYDVFLSFRGPDTRNTFTGHLFQGLNDKGINVFIDNNLERGEVITAELLKVIEESRISIVVISKNYASSSFCLDELVKILECREFKLQTVYPVFYHVDPTDVEEQIGTFGQNFAKLEAQLNWPNLTIRPMKKRRIDNDNATESIDKVRKWRLALTVVARLSGWHLQNGNHEATTIQSVVKSVLKQLNHTPIHVTNHPIGLDSRVNGILKELNMELGGVHTLGLCGLGGVGKTTIAKALYNKCMNLFEFDGSCFLLNVRERSKKDGFAQLQETILFKILGEKKCLFGNSDEGIELIKQGLRGKKVLLVIDDVDYSEQLEKLVGGLKWFDAGSRIIITSRDSRLLKEQEIKRVHEIQKLENDEAMELFSWHAFKKSKPSEIYMELSRHVIRYAQGLPLALEVLGSLLFGRTIPEWKDVLEQLKRYPNEKITDILKVSYDGLSYEEKVIFLDIAVFFKGMKKDDVTKFLKACGRIAYFGIRRLVEKSLVYVFDGMLLMHDLLKEMGIQIGKENSSRLCIQKQEDIHMFLENKGEYDVEILVVDLDNKEEQIPLKFLEDSRKLRILVIRNGRFIQMPKKLPNSIKWLEWYNCPISPQLLPVGLVVLLMPCSSIDKSLSKVKWFMNLTHMIFSSCMYLKKTVDFSALSNLTVLDLCWCKKLEKIKSLGKKLEQLNLWGCSSLTSIPNMEENECLTTIYLDYCSKLEKLPNLPTSLKDLSMKYSGIREIPWFIGDLVNLHNIYASDCKNLISVPNNIYNLPLLKNFYLAGCPNLVDAESFIFSSNLPYPFRALDLSRNKFVSLPTNIFKFSKITILYLTNCEWLVEIPALPRCLCILYAENCKSLVRFSQFQFDLFQGDFTNCHKLAAEKEMGSWRQLLENEKQVSRLGVCYDMVLPGNEIPGWFRYVVECEGNEVPFKLPPLEADDNLICIAWCAVFQSNPECTAYERELNFEFPMYRLRSVFFWRANGLSVESEHMWFGSAKINLGEILPKNEFLCKFFCHSELGVEIAFKRCGVHLIYGRGGRDMGEESSSWRGNEGSGSDCTDGED